MRISYTQTAILGGLAVGMLVGIPAVLWLVPPPFFNQTVVEIERGTTATAAAEELAEAGVIYSPELVSLPLALSDDQIAAGTYKFDEKINAVAVVDRLTSGAYGMPQAQVVIPEGFSNEEVSQRLAEVLSPDTFSPEIFVRSAFNEQGYLYPDTYYLHADATASEVIEIMRANFEEKIAPLRPEITQFGQDLEAVVKMASLIEREAADYEIRRRIAGVLWSRLEQEIPLQVDAVFVPLLGKNTYELTRADLQIDSPYNLYINTGLPPRPIANPGIAAIRAAINPIRSDDLYYLTGNDGTFYFAETLEEHNQNKRAFLD